MKALYPGHAYLLNDLDPSVPGQILSFVRKEKQGEEFVTVSNGTTNEEVLAAMIDRMNCLQGKAPCRENAIVITKLEEALMWLNKRTADRIARGVENTPKL